MFFDINGKPIGDGKLVSHAVNKNFIRDNNFYEIFILV